ncbi:MAG: DNA mismatch repair protein MutS [Nitrospinaceae bacterium]|nr:DNA mismatch repair protein MutS [Nitrospinaceae bacterium]NIR54651.1 DNA mismatch repair protein MutS [Nitrospinaceae bacterium]NIS85068.1 DNA mismatch repair protein MutS [Nitrospinaceae bacterium]NIT81885.1 DNA mismatch repair protein MutS [Nitrospinaceae bacterium]NIU44149.1 DNA mismatch repair protein MutS [Nitrospinaceae bacterium]
MTESVKKKKTGTDDTPMMQQYQSIKREYPDAILFFRMGDFYEMFNEDAKTASKILEIALTSRNKNQANPVPMCGIPHHSSNLYISKLVRQGKKIAICEQVEDPRLAKGLVKREVVRVITPGTVLEDHLLDPKSHHYLASVYAGREGTGLAVVDLSTGEFKTTEIKDSPSNNLLIDELRKLDPREIIAPESLIQENGLRLHELAGPSCYLHPCEDWTFSHSEAYRNLTEHFKTHSLEGFGCESRHLAVSAAGALIRYLCDTQKSALQHINTLSTFNLDSHMWLDPATIDSLELVRCSDGNRKHSLLDLLDECQTPMGARLLRDWILKPLVDRERLEERLNSVTVFHDNLMDRNDLRSQLNEIYDLERLLGRISLAACSPRDLVTLKNSLAALPGLKEILKRCDSKDLQKFIEGWDNLESVHRLIDRMIVDDPPHQAKDGHLIQPGCHEELDRLKAITRDGNQSIAALEARERERTGIPQMKVGFNKIYGYYLEVTKKNLDRVPDDYIRKQSLVNCERFISPELKQYETEITGAEDKILALEQELFQDVRRQVAAEGKRIQSMAALLAELDTLAGLAEVAHRYNYTRPVLQEGTHLNMVNGRHPLIERLDSSQAFIPNNTHLDCGDNQIMIITGPNMAGKSTYLRQVALITLMAQIGGYVPAEKAELGLVDRIFSRVGAQDHLLKGQSTFMVEMNEAANILNNATRRSLIILDEIGRGTSTFDGISIAWSMVEYLHGQERIGAKTLFATHYHELTELGATLSGVNNFNVQVKEWNDEIIFLRKIVPGGADKSYGIQVARLAGLPEKVLKRAHEVLFNLENKEYDEAGTPTIGKSEGDPPPNHPQQLGLFAQLPSPLMQKLQELDPDELTPRKALEKWYEIQEWLNKP